MVHAIMLMMGFCTHHEHFLNGQHICQLWITVFWRIVRQKFWRKYMYSFKSKIRYSEVDQNCFLTLDKLIDYFQDCSIFHSESIGLGVDNLMETKHCWMLTAWQIVIDRMPRLTEEVVISTWPYSFRGFNGGRNFQMTDEDGNSIARADSQWVFVDAMTGHPTRCTDDQINGYKLEEKMELPCDAKRIRMPEDCDDRPSFFVRKDQIDTNHHVNNGQYVKMALEELPENIEVHQLRAEYRRQAVLGDEIFPKVKHEDGVWTVFLCNEEGKPYSTVEIQ